MTATSVARGETETSVDGAATLLSDCSRTNAEVNLTMRAVIREKLMVPLLFVAALAGISLTVSGYWAVWQSQKSSSDGVMPQALVTLPERRPLAEFILVDDAKGFLTSNRWNHVGRLFSLASRSAPIYVPLRFTTFPMSKKRLLHSA